MAIPVYIRIICMYNNNNNKVVVGILGPQSNQIQVQVNRDLNRCQKYIVFRHLSLFAILVPGYPSQAGIGTSPKIPITSTNSTGTMFVLVSLQTHGTNSEKYQYFQS